MTEALPVCDVTIDEIDAAGPGDGVLVGLPLPGVCLLYTSDAADERSSVDLGGRRSITKKTVPSSCLPVATRGDGRY